MQNTKAAKELAALKDWHDMNGRDPNRAFYGPGHVFAAAELGAVDTLLLSDTLFHVNNVDKVRANDAACLPAGRLAGRI